MKHIFRFLGTPLENNQKWLIDDKDEIHHLKNVLKLKENDIIEVTDGKGEWARSKIIQINKMKILTHTIDSHHDPLNLSELTIGIGMIRHNSLDDILPALVEIGIKNIYVFAQQNFNILKYKPHLEQRWNKIIKSTIKQSKQSYFPYFQIYKNLYDLLNKGSIFINKIAFDIQGTQNAINLSLTKTSTLAIIGSEAGFDEEEISLLKNNNFIFAKLSDNVLRTITASICAAYVLSSKLR